MLDEYGVGRRLVWFKKVVWAKYSGDSVESVQEIVEREV